MVWGSGGILVETEGSPGEEVLSSVGTQGSRVEPRPAEGILSVSLSSESQPWCSWAAMFLVAGRSYPVGSQLGGAGAQAGSQS